MPSTHTATWRARAIGRRADGSSGEMATESALESWRKRGVERVRLRLSTERAKKARGSESASESEVDSDDDAGAYDGPYVLRCLATQGARLEENVDFHVWRPRRGLDAEEMRARHKDVVGESVARGVKREDMFRENNLIVRGRGEGVDYVGKNFTHDLTGIGRAYERESGSDTMTTMLGRLRKTSESGTYDLELIPIAGGRVIDMDVRLHQHNYTKHSKAELADLSDPAVRAAINAKQLEAFASDKRKRLVNRMNAARKLDVSAIASPVQMEMHIADGAANVKTRAELVSEAGKTRNIPPHEATATEPSLAYPIESMPCYELFHKLRSKDLLAAVESGDVASDEKYEPLTKVLAARLVGGSKAELIKRAQLVLYADALCKMLGRDRIKEARAKEEEDGQKPVVPPEHPFLFTKSENVDPLLQGALIRSFMEEDMSSDVRQFIMAKHRKDLVILNVVLIALRVNNWSITFEEVRPHLKLDSKQMTAYVRQLGCKSVRGGKDPLWNLDLKGRALETVLPEIRARAKARAKKST